MCFSPRPSSSRSAPGGAARRSDWQRSGQSLTSPGMLNSVFSSPIRTRPASTWMRVAATGKRQPFGIEVDTSNSQTRYAANWRVNRLVLHPTSSTALPISTPVPRTIVDILCRQSNSRADFYTKYRIAPKLWPLRHPGAFQNEITLSLSMTHSANAIMVDFSAPSK